MALRVEPGLWTYLRRRFLPSCQVGHPVVFIDGGSASFVLNDVADNSIGAAAEPALGINFARNGMQARALLARRPMGKGLGVYSC